MQCQIFIYKPICLSTNFIILYSFLFWKNTFKVTLDESMESNGERHTDDKKCYTVYTYRNTEMVNAVSCVNKCTYRTA